MTKDRKAHGKRRNGTQTSTFGSPGRFGHDSAKFYQTRLYDGLALNQANEYIENDVPSHILDQTFLHSSELMDEIPDSSVHLMVTSPPYNVTKEYDEDLSLEDYRGLLKRVFAETHKKLVTGGRACVNMANLGRRPYIPLHSYIIEDMLDIGYLMRGEIIWDKGASGSSSTAWGSWQSAMNPVLRDVHEYILVFSKGAFSREKKEEKLSTITRDEFLEYTKSVWSFPAESARRIGHPAPFPVELPYRLVQLYTFKDEVVLDPFVGSGSTCIAAIRADRHYIGYDTSSDYVSLAEKRINTYRKQLLADANQIKLFD